MSQPDDILIVEYALLMNGLITENSR